MPLRFEAMRKELSAYISWFNEHRPHQALDGCTPREIYEDRTSQCPMGERVVALDTGLVLSVTYHEGRRHLPIIELQRAA